MERARISGLRAFLTDPRRIWKIVEEMSVEGLQSLLETIEYCERHEAGFMEAADVAIPLIEATSGDPDHFNPPVSTVDLDALLEKAETPRPRRRLWSIVKDLFHRRKGRPRFKGEWIRSYEKEREFWDGSHDLFRDLDKIVRFAMAVEHGLTFALDALYLERRELSQAVLRQTVDAADRILGERLWDSDRCEEPRPENLGEILRCRSYAEALLTGSLDLANLRQALELLEPALKGKSPADEYDQAGFLAVIRLHLICGAADRAIQLLNRWEKLMWIRSDQLDALLAAVDGRLEAFDAFFDRWRAPRPPSEPFENPQMLRLELGILREQYLTHRGEPLSWDRVISEIAR